jgi:hypothetical protein
MTDVPPGGDLAVLSELAVPVHHSRGLEGYARLLATRFERAHGFFSSLFGMSPQVGLVVLSADDWLNCAHASFPTYGLTYYFDRQIVTGGPDTTFWRPLVDALVTTAPHLAPQLRDVYGRQGGQIALTPHVEWWIVHDLGHAFHVHLDYWFPRIWLMELFANLCLYTYLATSEPAYLSVQETLPRLLSQLPAAEFRYRKLSDFDAQYLNMDLVNYLWYHAHFFACAKRAYDAAGSTALDRLWRRLVMPNVRDVAETELDALLQHIQPEFAQMIRSWPA